MNTTSRIGKIARLPHSIREQLNLKLHDGIPAKSILPWLNSLPEVKAILAADFDNRPISKQNLSEWKHGGHRDWLLQYHASQFLQFLPSDVPRASSPASSTGVPPTEFEDATKSNPSSVQSQNHPDEFTHHASRITSKLLLWTQLQYTTMARYIDSETDPDRKWAALRQFANDISRLRRSTLADDYLQIQRDWLSLSQSNTADKKEKEFWKWTQRPDIEKKLFPERRPGLTHEQLYQFEKDCCLLDGPGPEIAELMAEVRIAKKLLELRKAQEAEARAKAAPDYDPNRPLPDTKVRLAGMPFEELFPTIPEKPLTQTHPDLDDPDLDDSNGHGAASALARAAGTASPQNPAENACPLPTAEGQPTLRSLSSKVLLTEGGASDEGGGEVEGTFHQPSAHDPEPSDSSYPSDPRLPSVALLAKEGPTQLAPPKLPSEGGSNPVKPSQTKSNHPLPFEPDITHETI
jgi:hypothetical protein